MECESVLICSVSSFLSLSLKFYEVYWKGTYHSQGPVFIKYLEEWKSFIRQLLFAVKRCSNFHKLWSHQHLCLCTHKSHWTQDELFFPFFFNGMVLFRENKWKTVSKFTPRCNCQLIWFRTMYNIGQQSQYCIKIIKGTKTYSLIYNFYD